MEGEVRRTWKVMMMNADKWKDMKDEVKKNKNLRDIFKKAGVEVTDDGLVKMGDFDIVLSKKFKGMPDKLAARIEKELEPYSESQIRIYIEEPEDFFRILSACTKMYITVLAVRNKDGEILVMVGYNGEATPSVRLVEK